MMDKRVLTIKNAINHHQILVCRRRMRGQNSGTAGDGCGFERGHCTELRVTPEKTDAALQANRLKYDQLSR